MSKGLTGLAAIVVALILTIGAGCGAKLIPGTQIKDTLDTRALSYLVGEKYRSAMEARDAATLLAMTSTRFMETGGSPSPDDDYDYNGLKKRLDAYFKKVVSLKLEIKLTDIIVDQEAGRAYVRFHYFLKYLTKYSSEEKWASQSDDAEIKFIQEGGEWKVIGGL